MMTKPTSLPDTGFVRLPQILAVIPISRSQWLKGVKDGKYPKPIKLGPRITAWLVNDIRDLINQMSPQPSDGSGSGPSTPPNTREKSKLTEIAKLARQQKREMRAHQGLTYANYKGNDY